jgi:hypothetical protein
LQVVLKYTGADLAPGFTPASAQEQIDMVLKIYKHTLKRVELRDELFAQLLKQTRNNPDRWGYALFLSFMYREAKQRWP